MSRSACRKRAPAGVRGRGVEVVNGGARAVWSALSGRFCGAGYAPVQAGGGGVIELTSARPRKCDPRHAERRFRGVLRKLPTCEYQPCHSQDIGLWVSVGHKV
ncbi:hypothetical protein RE9416_32490 [Prescottella equi]|nr:hypothetical protein RE9416_32490 [Prescottella equi]